MPREATVTNAPVRILHGGRPFEFDKDGTRQVTEEEEALLSSYTSDRFRLTFADKKKEKTDGQ